MKQYRHATNKDAHKDNEDLGILSPFLASPSFVPRFRYTRLSECHHAANSKLMQSDYQIRVESERWDEMG